MVLSCIGSNGLTIYAFDVEGGPIFEFNDFTGNSNEFLEEVTKCSDPLNLAQCFGFVSLVASVWFSETTQN
jgi:hypothetical protein